MKTLVPVNIFNKLRYFFDVSNLIWVNLNDRNLSIIKFIALTIPLIPCECAINLSLKNNELYFAIIEILKTIPSGAFSR